jgi:site-specific DNA recombinase
LRFSAVYRVGGSKSLPLFTPGTGGGSRSKNRSFKRCGEIYRRVHWNNRGKKSIVWRCVSRLENTGLTCHSRTVLEDMIGLATVDAINKLIVQKDGFLTILKENIETVISETDNNIVSEIDKKLEELQKDLLRLANSKEDYNDIADEIYRLREERHKALAEEAGKKGSKQRLEDMEKFLNEQSTLLEEYDEQLVRRLIEKITVYDDKLTIEFKSGVEVDV